MNILSISSLLILATGSILFFILIFLGRAKLHKIWAFFNVAVIVWGLGTYLASRATNIPDALFSWRVAIVGGLFIAVLFYHTVIVFCEKNRKINLFLVYLMGILFSIIVATKETMTGWRMVFNIYYCSPNLIHVTYVLWWIIIVAVGHLELFKFFKQSGGIKRTQSLYLFSGFLFGFVGGGSILLPTLNFNVYPIGNFGIPIYSLIVTYAIFKYHILDIKIAFSRVGTFLAVYSIILGVPFWIGLKYLGKGPWLLPTSICAILATVCPFVFILTQRRVEDSLLQKERNSHKLLEEASYGMTTVKELQQILKLSVDLAIKILDFKKSSIFLFEENVEQFALKASNPEGDEKVLIGCNDPLIKRLEKKKVPIIYDELKMNHDGEKESTSKQVLSLMDELSAKAIIPIMMKDRLLGFLVLGDRDSNGIFTRELVGILTILCNQAALAIENASFIKDRERDLDKQAQEQRFQMMGEMAVGISHQINNRFQSIIRSTELAITMYYMYKNKEREDLHLEAIAKRLVEGIEKANKYSQGGREVVDKILEFSKASFDATEIEFNETLQTAIELVKLKHSKFQYEIETNLYENIVLIASEASLQDILFNALDNSIMSMEMKKQDAKPEDDYKPKICIQGEVVDGKFCLKIEDNGFGIKKENLSKVTNPMFTTKGHNQGTGMGTTIMLRFVQQLGGTMKYESEYGQFCRLKIVLPINKKKGDNFG